MCNKAGTIGGIKKTGTAWKIFSVSKEGRLGPAFQYTFNSVGGKYSANQRDWVHWESPDLTNNQGFCLFQSKEDAFKTLEKPYWLSLKKSFRSIVLEVQYKNAVGTRTELSFCWTKTLGHPPVFIIAKSFKPLNMTGNEHIRPKKGKLNETS